MVTKLCSGQDMLYKINQTEIIKKPNKVELRFCALHLSLLPETCLPKMESFEPMVTKLCSGQDLLYKINQRGIIKKRNRVGLWFLRTAIRVIAISMHTKFGVIWTHNDKVTLRTRKARRRRGHGRGHGRGRRRPK